MNTQQLIMVSSYLQALEVNDTLYLDDDFECDEGVGYIGPAYVSMPGSYDHQLIIYFKDDGFYFRNHELDPIDENGVPTSIAIKSLRHLLDLIYTSKGKGDEHHKRLEARNQLRRADQEQDPRPPSVTLSREEFVEALRESAAPAQPEVSDEEDYPRSYSTDSEYDFWHGWHKDPPSLSTLKQFFKDNFKPSLEVSEMNADYVLTYLLNRASALGIPLSDSDDESDAVDLTYYPADARFRQGIIRLMQKLLRKQPDQPAENSSALALSPAQREYIAELKSGVVQEFSRRFGYSSEKVDENLVQKQLKSYVTAMTPNAMWLNTSGDEFWKQALRIMIGLPQGTDPVVSSEAPAKKLSETEKIKQRFSKEFHIPIDRVTIPVARNQMLNEMYEWGEKAVIDRTHLFNVPPKAFWQHVDRLMDKISAKKAEPKTSSPDF